MLLEFISILVAFFSERKYLRIVGTHRSFIRIASAIWFNTKMVIYVPGVYKVIRWAFQSNFNDWIVLLF